MTAMEAMEHPYFCPIAKDHRLNAISASPTTALGLGGSVVSSSPILSPGGTPAPVVGQN